MRNAEIAAALRELGILYELDGADRFRVLAYREAARTVANSPVSVEQLAEEGRLTELAGVGKTLAEKIETLIETGSIPSADKLKAKFPATLVEVTRVPGLGAKTAKRIYDEIGVESLQELKEAAEQGRIAGIRGLGPKTEENILSSLEGVTEDGIGERLLLSNVLPIAEEICGDLKELGVASRIEMAGSARRWAETCKDLDLIATTDDPARLTEALATHGLSAETRRGGDAAASVLTHAGLKVDLRIGPEETFGDLLQHFTGSAAHNVQLRERALARGLSVSEYGVAKVEGKKVHKFADEAGVYELLGLPYIEPELRADRGEIEAGRPGHDRRNPRGPPLPHDALGRPQLAGGDGGRGPRARLRLPGGDRPLGEPRLRQRRQRQAAGAANRGDPRLERVRAARLPVARWIRGQHRDGRVTRLSG
jgi:DNA polymerase (family X)